jgi:DNA mismatch repair protein MutS
MISRAKSTFLVEMEETARILNQSTSRSLILLDEIGRGTSTFDGVSIAWAVAEYIHDKIGARTMFATHYHELSQLELVCAGVKNFNVAVKEWDGKIIFLRRLVRGGANHSYGIDVAKMAALPKSVVERAREILKDLEAHSMTPPGVKASDEPPAPFAPRKRKGPAPRYEPSLFDWAAQKLAQPSEVEAELAATDVETLSPLEALNLLAKLKKLVKK